MPQNGLAAQGRAVLLVRRFSWGLGDQILSSLTNFTLGLVVARTVSPRDFGAFALVYALYILTDGISQALAGEPLIVRYSACESNVWRAGVRGAVSTALALGVIIGTGCLVGAFLTGGPLRSALLVLGLLLPALLVQDVWRFAFFAEGRGAKAFVNDLVWAIVLFPLVALALWSHLSSLGWLVTIWAGAGAAAAFVGLAQTRILPGGVGEVRAWLKTHSDLAPRFVAEFALSGASANLTPFVIASITKNLAQVAWLRAGQLAFGPLGVLFTGAGIVSVAEGVRLLRRSSASLMRAARVMSLSLAVITVAWGLAMWSLPVRIGTLVLGQNWAGARSVIIPVMVGMAGLALAFGPVTGLRSLAAAKRSLRARVADASLTTCLMVLGTFVNGAIGAAWGSAIAASVRVPIWWWHFLHALSENEETRAKSG
jgi:O-antigen/teichoic acid export membrane protein